MQTPDQFRIFDKCLWRGEKAIRRGLATVAATCLESPDETIVASLRAFMAEMTGHLYLALTAREDDAVASGPDIYFWPSYDSVLKSRENPERLVAYSPTTGRAGGIGYQNPNSSEDPYYDCSDSWVYGAILVEHADDVIANSYAFLPGGTHPWIAATDLEIDTNTRFCALEVAIVESGLSLPRHSVDPNHGILKVSLDMSSFSTWGSDLSDVLNDPAVLHEVPDSAVRVRWPHARNDPSQIANEKIQQQVDSTRKGLYNLWLAAVVGYPGRISTQEWHRGFEGWLRGFKESLRNLGLKRLSDRIDACLDDLSTSGNPVHSHRYWYVLNLSRAVGLGRSPGSASEEIGSLMILSSEELNPDFIPAVKPWVERIYTWMRAVEDGIIAWRAGRRSQSSEFVHQVAGLVDEVVFDEGVGTLSPQAQSAAWHMHALVTIWSTRQLLPLQTVFESPNHAFWRRFKNHPPADFLDFLIEAAFRHTFRRALLRPEMPDLVSEPVQDFVLETWQTTQPIRRRLQFAVSGEIPRWLYSMGFVISFHHCFWQAAYHALRASFADLPGPFLWLEFSETSAAIHNRSLQPTLPVKPKDFEFFDRLRARLKGAYEIGMMFDESDRILTTEIRYGASK